MDALLARYKGMAAALAQSAEATRASTVNCWTSVDAHQSRWKLWTEIAREARGSVAAQQKYLAHVQQGLPAPVQGMVMTKIRALELASPAFQNYCPVSYAESGFLVKTEPHDLTNAVMYKDHLYWCAGQKEVAQFISSPEVLISLEMSWLTLS